MYRKTYALIDCEAIENNIKVIKKYGWKIALLECVSDYFAEIIPVTGGFIYGCYRLMVAGDISVSEFSVLVSAITTCRNKLNQPFNQHNVAVFL